MLRPIDNEWRERRCLNGLWRFAIDPEGSGRTQQWWKRPLAGARDIAVPSSYNDLFPDAQIRDHVGDAWYQVEIQIPMRSPDIRWWLRFDAATHRATVWLDDTELVSHEGGYMPFEADISALVRPGSRHRLTVCVNNELHWHTIPPGRVIQLPDGRRRQEYFHDFFNYAGLHRSVWLYSTPAGAITGLTVETEYRGGPAVVHYNAHLDSHGRADAGGGEVVATLLDAEGREVGRARGASGRIELAESHPWQPGRAYLYLLVVDRVGNGIVEDRYSLPVGIRSIEVAGRRLLINGRPFYFTGFGMHEDSAVRGKGFDNAVMVNDFALLDWIGANSFRTSHYPYAEEVLDHADRHGIVVIDEAAAVGMNLSLSLIRATHLPKEVFSDEAVSSRTQATHLQALRELVARDRNHPSVVMWSVANEPDVRSEASRAYFEPLIAEVRRLDRSRPLTVVNVQFCGPDNDRVADLLDVLCLNRYTGWYRESGDLAAAEPLLEAELRAWTAKYDKPIMMTEFGCDAMNGLHAAVPSMWTEQYQADFIAMFQRVLDRIGSLIGEQVWCFADFATGQGPMRVGGNRKGVFTRDRQPKAAALSLRQRWLSLRRNRVDQAQ